MRHTRCNTATRVMRRKETTETEYMTLDQTAGLSILLYKGDLKSDIHQ